MSNILGFVKHYGLAFVWLSLVLFTFIVIILIVIAPNQQTQTSIASLLMISIVAALIRAFQGGWRPEKGKSASDTLAVNLFTLVLSTIVWPFIELFRQLRFLLHAYKLWQKGQIIVDEDNKMIRSG